MKKIIKGFINPKNILIIAVLFFTAFQSNGQLIKRTQSGNSSVNGIKVYYEVYDKGKPIVLMHSAFYTIEMNWGQIIPETVKN